MSTINEKLDEAKRIYLSAIETYKPTKVFCLFSGGHDSLAVTHWGLESMGADGAAHVNTGIGVRQTREFVRDVCKDYSWPLYEYQAGAKYEDIIREHGFPGPSSHRYMYVLLKERGIEALLRDHKTKRSDRIMLVTGVRAQESIRRMGTTEPVKKHKARIWVAPFIDFEKKHVNAYLNMVGAPRNPVVDHLHMSGECLCGAFAHKGELAQLEFFYPEAAEEIYRLEKIAKEAGKPWGWEHPGPPEWYKLMEEGQQILGFENDPQMLCTSCNKRHSMEGL
ncbi:MAG: phosphoadenosine phosphosulfate reductase family protein [Wenzhouxiangella sp.]|nr:phosphoadenosine phosphosulfate reductase family protein [Wenzhouxiangella sp.]